MTRQLDKFPAVSSLESPRSNDLQMYELSAAQLLGIPVFFSLVIDIFFCIFTDTSY